LEPTSGKVLWTKKHRLRALAMVATEGLLFAAGMPDLVDPGDPLGVFEGRKGGLLLALDARSGESIGELKLASPRFLTAWQPQRDGCIYPQPRASWFAWAANHEHVR
jgi:hypothetical protein